MKLCSYSSNLTGLIGLIWIFHNMDVSYINKKSSANGVACKVIPAIPLAVKDRGKLNGREQPLEISPEFYLKIVIIA